MMIKTTSNISFASVCLFFSATMWGLIWYPLRILEQAGMPAVWVSFAMYAAVVLVTLPWAFKHRFFQKMSWDLAWLGLAAGLTTVAFLVALNEGEVMRVMLLLYLSPIWSVLLSRWWLGERLSPMAMLMFVLAVIGSFVMLWNPEIGFPWPNGLGDWLAIISSLAFSVNNVMSRKLAEESMVLRAMAVWWGIVAVASVALILLSMPVPALAPVLWLGAAAMGIFGMIAVSISTLYGLAKMPVYRSAMIMLFELIVGAVSAWWLIHEVLSPAEWIGGLLIVVAAIGIAKMES